MADCMTAYLELKSRRGMNSFWMYSLNARIVPMVTSSAPETYQSINALEAVSTASTSENSAAS